jgi:flagellar biosynthesis protein FliP
MIQRAAALLTAIMLGLAVLPHSALAEPQSALSALSTLVPQPEGTVSGRILQLIAVMTVLSVAPGLIIMVTCFTRFIIAFSFLRTGMGLQTTPSNIILLSLAMFMTLFVMAPIFNQAWEKGLEPLIENRIAEKEAFAQIAEPFRDFMKKNVRERDLQLFSDLSAETLRLPGAKADDDLRVLIPAFMISEIRRGFEIGFLIILPFLVIDLIVATLTMSMGMMMMPPTVISVPFKILFFVLIDGWNLLVGGLIRSFA